MCHRVGILVCHSKSTPTCGDSVAARFAQELSTECSSSCRQDTRQLSVTIMPFSNSVRCSQANVRVIDQHRLKPAAVAP
jgi:hypothetical protein